MRYVWRVESKYEKMTGNDNYHWLEEIAHSGLFASEMPSLAGLEEMVSRCLVEKFRDIENPQIVKVTFLGKIEEE